MYPCTRVGYPVCHSRSIYRQTVPARVFPDPARPSRVCPYSPSAVRSPAGPLGDALVVGPPPPLVLPLHAAAPSLSSLLSFGVSFSSFGVVPSPFPPPPPPPPFSLPPSLRRQDLRRLLPRLWRPPRRGQPRPRPPPRPPRARGGPRGRGGRRAQPAARAPGCGRGGASFCCAEVGGFLRALGACGGPSRLWRREKAPPPTPLLVPAPPNLCPCSSC